MKSAALLVMVVALGLLAGCVTGPGGTASAPSTGSATAARTVLADTEISDLVAAVTQRTPAKLATPRLAAGLTPPTNRWYSGLVFGAQAQPVFPLPLSFGLTADGFAFGQPEVVTTASTIAGGYHPAVQVDLGAASSVVTSSDPSVVVLENRDASGAALGHTTIAQGWPFVAWTAAKGTTVRLPVAFTAAADGLFTATVAGATYAVKTTDATLKGDTVSVRSGGQLLFWVVPTGGAATDLAGLGGVPTGSQVSYQLGSDTVTTTLTYTGAGAIARLPHQGTAGECALGTYASSYGTMTLCRGDSITWTVDRVRPQLSLDLSGLTAAERDSLTVQLRADAADLGQLATDSYYGGKALQRLAMLLMVADQLGVSDVATKIATTLDTALSRWTQPQGCAQRESQCFVYDPVDKGMIGLAASFGSEQYNDHVFHYGYFLYAAAVMAGHDASSVQRYAPVLNLIAADLASVGNSYFPDRRNFDAYASHSWASGTAPFADGNNQESVSEAINGYAGLSLWAAAIGNATLTGEADWMVSLEASASADYWVQPDLDQPEFSGYAHRIVVLNWGGKRDYATWFSAAPAAKLGILLLPMSPTSTYLAGDPARIRANVAEATGGDFSQGFGDYLLMYSALAGEADRKKAVTAALALPTNKIDDGMSRTYLLAWLYSRKF